MSGGLPQNDCAFGSQLTLCRIFPRPASSGTASHVQQHQRPVLMGCASSLCCHAGGSCKRPPRRGQLTPRELEGLEGSSANASRTPVQAHSLQRPHLRVRGHVLSDLEVCSFSGHQPYTATAWCHQGLCSPCRRLLQSWSMHQFRDNVYQGLRSGARKRNKDTGQLFLCHGRLCELHKHPYLNRTQ
jgi:hypothetical protein